MNSAVPHSFGAGPSCQPGAPRGLRGGGRPLQSRVRRSDDGDPAAVAKLRVTESPDATAAPTSVSAAKQPRFRGCLERKAFGRNGEWSCQIGAVGAGGQACRAKTRWRHRIRHHPFFGSTKRRWNGTASPHRWRDGGGQTRVRTLTNNHHAGHWKLRGGRAGLHAFNRATGLNILLNDTPIPASLHSRAPRHVSIALTNRCDLACAHCYAPKSRDELRFDTITGWLVELDAAGTLGIGFGGGEPTLYSRLPQLCEYTARETRLSVSFTTHGHHIDRDLSERLQGNVHFIRVSMDGVEATYESIRRRSFPGFIAHLAHVRTISRFGVNVVVNDRTLPELDEVARVAADAGACELLLLPQVPVRTAPAIDASSLRGLRRWVDSYKGPLKLCINESSAEGFPTCDPLSEECGLRAYAHIDASAVLKASSYADLGVQIGKAGILQALSQLAQDLAENDT